MSPVDFATKRREADRRELERAIREQDWAAALDVLAANVHEVEQHTGRAVSEITEMRGEVRALARAWETANEQIGAAVLALEEAKRAALDAKQSADASQQRSILASEKAAEAIIARAATAAQLSVSEDARRSLADHGLEEARVEQGARLSVWWRRNRWPLAGTLTGLVLASGAGALITWLLTRR